MDSISNRNLDSTLQTLFSKNTGQVFVIGPSKRLITSITNLLFTSLNPPSIRILSDGPTIKETTNDFITASYISELSSTGILELRTAETLPKNELLLTSNSLITIINAGNSTLTLTTPAQPITEDVYTFYNNLWSQSIPFHIATPPFSLVLDSLQSKFGSTVESDFAIAILSLQKLPSSYDFLDEVALSLLIAARNQILLYDLSRWGEDIGLASRATFSRTKQLLEQLNLITTETVPVNVGRPRLRLRLNHPLLETCPPGKLLTAATELLPRNG